MHSQLRSSEAIAWIVCWWLVRCCQSVAYNGKIAKYKAVTNRNGYLFVAFVVDRFGTVIKGVQNLMFQMFKRNAKNNCNEISDAEANIIASRKLKILAKKDRLCYG